METSKVSTTSYNIKDENLEKLRNIFPQFVKDGIIDFDALQNFFEKEGLVAGPEKYGLNWAGRSNAFQAIRTPSTGTLTPQEDESKNWDETENIFIEGDNLEVLKLLQKHYREKIKMIYIDPPYNTGKDFVYKDNFTQGVADYYEQTGQTKNGIKMTANTEKNGRYHSDWLTMMYPRLFLARNLLKDDGVIFVSIDDNEVANLRLIMDEIFGEENFVAQISWRRTDNQSNIGNFARVKEYIILYAKNINNLTLNKLALSDKAKNEYRYSDKKGIFRRNIILDKVKGRYVYEIKNPSGEILNGPWMIKEDDFKELLIKDGIYWANGKNGQPYGKIYLEDKINDGQIPHDFWGIEFGTNQRASLEVEELFNSRNFDFPKPVSLIKSIVKIGTNSQDLILDFFAGSGTTAHAVMDLNAEDEGNRKWICVQLPEETDEKSEAYKAGYKNIAEISRERIRRAGEKIGKGDIGFKSFKLSNSNYRKWNELGGSDDTETILKQSKLFIEKPLVDGYDEKSVVYEILEKEGFGLNAKIEQEKGDLKPWVVAEGERKLVVTFSKKVSKENVDALKLSEHDIFVCFDSALDDTTKVNIARNVNFKVI